MNVFASLKDEFLFSFPLLIWAVGGSGKLLLSFHVLGEIVTWVEVHLSCYEAGLEIEGTSQLVILSIFSEHLRCAWHCWILGIH